MIELIVLIILSRRNGKRAKEKGYSSGIYTFMTIAFYLTGELIGGIVGFILGQQNLLVYYLMALLGGISGGITASIIVVNLKSKYITNTKEETTFYPEEPDALWECPSCRNNNTNTTFECIHCGYEIQ